MGINDLEISCKREFNNSVCLIGIIPSLVFMYVLVGKISSIRALQGETGYILMIAMSVLLLGIFTGRRVMWSAVSRLFEYNKKILVLQSELLEKERLASVTETAMALSHEINNPLMIMRGNLDMLDNDFKGSTSADVTEKISKVKGCCERIKQVTDKLANLTKPVSSQIYGDVKMVDLSKSV